MINISTIKDATVGISNRKISINRTTIRETDIIMPYTTRFNSIVLPPIPIHSITTLDKDGA